MRPSPVKTLPLAALGIALLAAGCGGGGGGSTSTERGPTQVTVTQTNTVPARPPTGVDRHRDDADGDDLDGDDDHDGATASTSTETTPTTGTSRLRLRPPPPTTTATSSTAPTPTTPTTPQADRHLLIGIQDDALLTSAEPKAWPTTRALGPKIIRYNIAWDQLAPQRPKNPSDPADPAYEWEKIDRLATTARSIGARDAAHRSCRRRAGPTAAATRAMPRLTRPTTARSAGSSRGATRGTTGRRARPAARGRPLHRLERGQPRPVLPAPGRARRGRPAPLRPAYAACRTAIDAQNPKAQVAFGPLASRGAQHGAGPLPFIAGYRAAGGVKPDVFALNPYMEGCSPSTCRRRSSTAGRSRCATSTSSSTRCGPGAGSRSRSGSRSSPGGPRRHRDLGTSAPALQADLLGETVSLIVDSEPYVDMLIWFLVRDEIADELLALRAGDVRLGTDKPAFASTSARPRAPPSAGTPASGRTPPFPETPRHVIFAFGWGGTSPGRPPRRRAAPCMTAGTARRTSWRDSRPPTGGRAPEQS